MSSDPIEYLSNIDVQLPGIIKAVGRYSIKVQKVLPKRSFCENWREKTKFRHITVDGRWRSYCILQQVKGIGRWTAEMFLIFCLGRQDILHVTDLGIRKAMQKLYSLPELQPFTMLDISQPWKPYRSIAT